MAAHQMISASSSSVSLKKYDVFLSFQGEDTRRNFTSHLYDALIRKKVITFIDDNELQKGDDISPALTEAIEESYISIVIFSEDYASSKWCLNELIKILECKKDRGQIVIPVFYNIDPSHVRKQTRSYQRAFAKHKRALNLNKWKTTLSEAANLVGFDSTKYRNESDLIKVIVEYVLRKLKHRCPFKVQDKGLVRIEEKCEEIKSLLKVGSNDVRTLGLWGMGGIGKTTLAKALCAKLCPQFEGWCFLENVRDESKRDGLIAVRHRLFSNLLEEENFRLDAPYVETHSIMRKLLGKKFLIVLDDVSASKQIGSLMIDTNFLGSGSRVIVTTRDKRIIKHHVHEIYEVKELNECDSLELFCLNSFREKHPKIGYEELSKSAIAYCKGNPLALKVLGARLGPRSKLAWESDLEKLQKIPDMEILDVLKLSYDDLDRTQKDIFLDIACFFKGRDRDCVISVLEACGFFPTVGVEDLLDKALINISKYNEIEMHDLIQEMGREIINQKYIKEPGERSRLWIDEEVADVLKNNKGTEAVEGIKLDSSEVGDLFLRSDSFKRMTNLRYLEIYNGYTNICKIYFIDGLGWLSNKLRYLRWDSFPLECLPSNFSAEMLVELHMNFSKLKKLWDGVQNLVNLKKIDLHFSKDLIEMPDLSRATNLQTLSLCHCESLRELCPFILSLPKLEELDLRGCKRIESLKSNVHSKSLRRLHLQHCSSLAEFLVTSEEMMNLGLAGTAIREIPSSILSLPKLEVLDLTGCKKIESLKSNMHSNSLRQLWLDDCSSLAEFSVTSEEMVGLHLADTAIREIPSSILSLPKLEELHLTGCKKIESLKSNMHSKSLRQLSLNGCSSLTEFSVTSEEMVGLHLADTAIREIPSSIWRHRKLRSLTLSDCYEFDIIGNKLSNDSVIMESLKYLHLSGCTQIDSLNLSFLLDGIRSLEVLNLDGCRSLEALPHNIHKHLELYELVLDDCRQLASSLAELIPSSQLQCLSVVNCTLMDTDSIQRLMLDKINKLKSDWFSLLIPGDQVPRKFNFQSTEGASITNPPIPKLNLCGFIYCVILSQGLQLDVGEACILRCTVYEHREAIRKIPIPLGHNAGTLISDHVLLCWDNRHDRGENEGGHYSPSFKFQLCNMIGDGCLEWLTEGIKGCGVLPVYDLEHGLELDVLESESTAQACDFGEFQARAVGGDVEVSSNENDQQQPAYDLEEDFNEKSSCGCSIGLVWKWISDIKLCW